MDEQQRSGALGPPPDDAPREQTQPDDARAGNLPPEEEPRAGPASPAPEPTRDNPEAPAPAPSDAGWSSWTRRDFLRAAAWSAAGLWASQLSGIEHVAAAALPNFVIPPGLQPSYTANVKRRDDLLELRFEFYNLMLVASFQTGDAILQRINTGQPAYVVVVFPPQAIAERAFTGNQALSAPLTEWQWASAGESRLAFQLPDGLNTIPYTTESLLSWTGWQPRLVPAALPAGPWPSPAPQVRAPFAHETSIELPWRLMLSPHSNLGWAHSAGLVTHNGRTEIWHTRLGVRKGNVIDEWDANDRTVRAVWTPDRPITHPFDLFTTSLTAEQRRRIVEATADAAAVTDGTPVPVQVNRLMLTPLGGWLDVVGAWDNHNDLLSWRHLATMGRDHYVRVVEKGYLFPYGHAAARIDISEREFNELDGHPGGFLRKRVFLVVRQPVKSYGGSLQPNDGRAWPFRRVRLTTLATPVLDDPGQNPSYAEVQGAFQATINGQPFHFHMTATDWEGRDSDFMAPIIFVPRTPAFSATSMQNLITAFNNLNDNNPLRRRAMGGQKVALAPFEELGDTTLELTEMILGAGGPAQGASAPQLEAAEQPRFFPTLIEFGARLSAVEQASANSLSTPPRFELDPVYVSSGFGGNPGGVFANIKGLLPAAEFGADSGGGLATPNFEPSVISRQLGAVGGLPADIRNGDFNPADIFKEGVAKLLGGIDLAHIIAAVNFTAPGNAKKAMKVATRPIHEVADDPTSRPIAIVTELEWEPNLQPDLPLRLFEPDPGSLRIDAMFRQDLDDPAQSTYEIEGDLRDFKLNLLGSANAFMVLRFSRLFFHARSGQKTKLEPLVDNITFAGPLEFVNKIEEFLTFGGSGPYIRPDAQGLTAGYDLPLPQIPLGALMINNIALSASLFIPWSGAPARIRFGLSSREKPFDVTYSAIGGGGFFGIAFGLDGLEKFECALELGAYLSIDLGVVGGSLSISAGIYFAIEKVQDNGDEILQVGLEAYIRFVGKVQALGIISISLEIYLALGFQRPPPKLKGIAKAEFKIKVLIFEGSVKVTVKRTISATPNDPTFEDLFDQSHWEEYALAFA